MYVGMRIERTHLSGITSVPARSREAVPDERTGEGDSVSIRFASQAERVVSIVADTYDPLPADIADALLQRAFDR
jgi:hypothetical protein